MDEKNKYKMREKIRVDIGKLVAQWAHEEIPSDIAFGEPLSMFMEMVITDSENKESAAFYLEKAMSSAFESLLEE